MTMNFVVMVLSLLLIVFISVLTFEKIDFLHNHAYMTFQFWVCMFFIADFFVGLWYARSKRGYFARRLLFLLLSIPYLNLVSVAGIHVTAEESYFMQFIPLARGALALSIVMGYVSRNAITSLFASYISIILCVTYFCSLIFYQREEPVNPQVTTYWTALWWAFMNMSTVGCNVSPMTVAGKIVGVILPIAGMVIFPLFTVYLTNYVTERAKGLTGRNQGPQESQESDASDLSDRSDSSDPSSSGGQTANQNHAGT